MKEVAIRFIDEKEIEELIILCELHAEFEKAEYNKDDKSEKLRSYLFSENPPLYCLVATRNEKIVGYATYMKQFSTWDANHYIYMDCLYLTEESRGLGIGQKLIERIQEEGKKSGIDLIQWQTPDFNQRAMKFYNRIGAKGKSKERYFLEKSAGKA